MEVFTNALTESLQELAIATLNEDKKTCILCNKTMQGCSCKMQEARKTIRNVLARSLRALAAQEKEDELRNAQLRMGFLALLMLDKSHKMTLTPYDDENIDRILNATSTAGEIDAIFMQYQDEIRDYYDRKVNTISEIDSTGMN